MRRQRLVVVAPVLAVAAALVELDGREEVAGAGAEAGEERGALEAQARGRRPLSRACSCISTGAAGGAGVVGGVREGHGGGAGALAGGREAGGGRELHRRPAGESQTVSFPVGRRSHFASERSATRAERLRSLPLPKRKNAPVVGPVEASELQAAGLELRPASVSLGLERALGLELERRRKASEGDCQARPLDGAAATGPAVRARGGKEKQRIRIYAARVAAQGETYTKRVRGSGDVARADNEDV